MYTLTIKKQAIKALRKMQTTTARRIRNDLDKLAENPDRADLDVKPLQGVPAFRMRVGGYRVIFERDDAIRVIAVERIAPRGDVYK